MVEDVRIDGTVVVGLGGIGSSAAYRLARRGETVLGLDPRAPGHREGSSHGGTRLVRQVYFENPAYVPLAREAWRLWRELEADSGEHLLTETGVLALARIGDPGRLVSATLEAARMHGLAVEHLDAAEVRRRFPAVRVPDDWEGAFERQAGFVDPTVAVRAHHRLAQAAGARFLAEEVLEIEPGETPVVRTARARYHPRAVVVTAGPWAPELLGSQGLPIRARRKVLAHFTPVHERDVTPDVLPGFLIGDGGRAYYGFPALPGQGVKIGRHDGGEVTTPATIDRTVRPEEVDELRRVLAAMIPGAAGPDLDRYTCLYTMSPDEDFLLGTLPAAPGCVVATGCSGHAYKFVPVLGELLADLAQGLRPALDIGFLSPGRFSGRSADADAHAGADADADADADARVGAPA